HVCAFWDGNRNAIAADQDLVTLLEKTDSGEIPMSAINWPFPCFYLALPAGLGLMLDKDSEIDGAYIRKQHGNLVEIVVTSRRLDIEQSASRWPLSADRYFYLSGEIEPEDTLNDFIARHTELEIAELLSVPNRQAEIDEYTEERFGSAGMVID